MYFEIDNQQKKLPNIKFCKMMKENKIFYKTIFLNGWGYLLAAISEKGLIRIELPADDESKIESVLKDLAGSYCIKEDAAQLREYTDWLMSYFRGDKPSPNLNIDWTTMSDFQRAIYKVCMKIPYGQTRSYWQLAVRMGNPYAARAVGGAMASNPLPIIIPCHRVIRSDNMLGGFGGGIPLKRKLLTHEGFDLSSLK